MNPKYKRYTDEMSLEKHELIKKSKLNFCNEYIDHYFANTIFTD